MKIVTKTFNEMLGNTIRDTNEKVEYMEACLKTITAINQLIEKIDNYKATEEKDFDLATLLVFDTDEFQGFDYSKVTEIHSRFLPSTSALLRRISTFLVLIKKAKDRIKEQTATFIPYEEEDLDMLRSDLAESCGHLACYTYYEFGLDDLRYNPNPDEIYDVLDGFMRKHDKPLEYLVQLADGINNLMNIYSPKMGVFERYPEMLEPFSNLVGADLYDCTDLDLKTIEGVVSGKIPVDSFREQLEILLEKEDNE